MSENTGAAADGGHRFQIRFGWRDDAGGEAGTVEANLQSHYPPSRYPLEFRWMFYASEHPVRRGGVRSREQAERYAHTAMSLVAFLDATGLRPSLAVAALWPRTRCAPQPPFDHTLVWHDGRRRFLVTTEPYGDGWEDVAAWCRENGWQCHACPPGIGLWNPAGGTRLVLASPPRLGVDIEIHRRIVWPVARLTVAQ